MELKHLSRRGFLKVAVMGAAYAALSACKPPATPAAAPTVAPQQPAPPTKPTAEPKVLLRFQTHSYAPLVSFVERKIREYKRVKPNVEIQYIYSSEDWGKILAAMAAGAGPDGFNQGDWQYPKFMKNKWLAPISPEYLNMGSDNEVISKFFPASTLELVTDGKLYGLPFEWQCSMLYYNMKLFEEVGLDPMRPPATWEEVEEYALKLAKWDAQGNIIREGIGQSYTGIWTLIRWRPFIYQLGGRWLSEDGKKMEFDSPEGIKAIQWNVDLTVKHKVCMKGFTVPGVTGISGSPYRGMFVSGAHEPASIKKNWPDHKYQVDWNYAPYPTWQGAKRVTGGWRWGLFCNSQSKQKSETWQFIKFMVDDWEGVLYDVGYYPSLVGWMDSEEGKQAVAKAPWLAGMVDDLAVAIPQPMTPHWDELMTPWNDGLDRMNVGEAVEKVVPEMVEQMNKILAQQ
jgi:sn-glycerol 3-phosphate transport system substrate-binding protein